MKSKKIYLVRHGEITTGGRRRFIGQIDLPLSDTGKKQASRLGDGLAGMELGAVFCSDLQRSIETAGIICEKIRQEPVCTGDLREISLGAWEGLAFKEVERLYPGEFKRRGDDMVNYRPPGGESFALLAARVLPALEDLAGRTEGDLLIVGHAGVNRVIIARALGLPLEKLLDIPQDYGCLNVLAAGAFGFRVLTLNHIF